MNKLITNISKATNKFGTSVARNVHKLTFGVKKHSPEILVITGCVGVLGGVVLACKESFKAKDIIEDTRSTLDKIDDFYPTTEEIKIDHKDDPEKAKALITKRRTAFIKTYTEAGLLLIKTYYPAAIIIGASIASIFIGNNILRKRITGLAAAYTTLEKTFSEYRKRVVEKYGEDIDKELRYGIKKEIVKLDDKDEYVEVKTADIDEPSDYARFFDESCANWTKNPEMNLSFLKAQQRSANDILKFKGFLFLNDVYEMLGIQKTTAGQVVGWVYDENNLEGDNYVDFGIYDLHNERKRSFVNGYERSILLDFNVQGSIIDLDPFKNYRR